jgi:hypothetical protein
MDDTAEAMALFMKDIAEDLGLDHKKVVSFCHDTYELDLDVETNKRSIEWRIKNEPNIKKELL